MIENVQIPTSIFNERDPEIAKLMGQFGGKMVQSLMETKEIVMFPPKGESLKRRLRSYIPQKGKDRIRDETKRAVKKGDRTLSEEAELTYWPQAPVVYWGILLEI